MGALLFGPLRRELLRSRVLRNGRHLTAVEEHVEGLGQQVLDRRVLAGGDDAELPGDLGREVTTNMLAPRLEDGWRGAGDGPAGPSFMAVVNLLGFAVMRSVLRV